MRILALDPATKCGWAHSDGPSGVWDLSIRRDESGGMRLLRFRAKLDEIELTAGVDVVVFEAARHAAPKMAGALVVQAELQGVLKLWCEQMDDVEFCPYSPAQIKKHATGKGNAPKATVLAAARERWPAVRIVDDNQADALWLLDLARSELHPATGDHDA